MLTRRAPNGIIGLPDQLLQMRQALVRRFIGATSRV